MCGERKEVQHDNEQKDCQGRLTCRKSKSPSRQRQAGTLFFFFFPCSEKCDAKNMGRATTTDHPLSQ